MTENEKHTASYRGLFSFGGADVTPLPEPLTAPKLAPERHAPEDERRMRKRPRDVAPQAPLDDVGLSDLEDNEEQVLQCARNFSRPAECRVAAVCAEWFEDGRQERLRNDLRQAHKRHTRSYKLTTSSRRGGRGKRQGK